MKLIEKSSDVHWDYDETSKEVVGLTVMGLRRKLLEALPS
jgi:hypothetical protein